MIQEDYLVLIQIIDTYNYSYFTYDAYEYICISIFILLFNT